MISGGGEVNRNGRWLSLRPGQVVLAMGVLGIIIALLLSSVISVTAHDNELQGLFSEEGDGTAMTFAQRESFGVVLELDDWARGESTARDVQIARALLGQRLQVVTASGVTTFDLTDEPYRRSLTEIDEVIRSLDDANLADRVAQRIAVDDLVDGFESRTRELSAVFKQITRDRAAAAISARADVEQVQGWLSLLVVIMGIGLAGWLAVDLRVAYARASQRLALETHRLEAARRSLEFRRALEELSHRWSDAIASGVPTDTIVATAQSDLRDILPEADLESSLHDDGTVVLVSAGPTESGESSEQEADLVAALDRANEYLRLARARDHRERSFEIERQHDPLTGLPNRERLPHAVADAITAARRRRRGAVAVVALVDVDRFADFNTSFGHLEGDRLLVDVARRLRGESGDEHAALRLSADEFAIVGAFRDEPTAHREVTGLAERLRFAFEVGGESAAIAVTVGAVISRSLHDAPDALIQRAAAALASAQGTEPRIPVRFFAWEVDEHLMEVMLEESALRSALRSGEFVVHFQPIIALESGDLAACEALVRWNRPGIGVVPPAEFLTAVARAGLTVELGWQIIDQALASWGSLRMAARGKLDEVYVSINLDAVQLAVPTLADYIMNAAQRSGVPSRCVVLEVTEHALLVGDVALAQLHRLRAQGIRVALDDFGTGYSSLAQASSLPLDILKIDRSFLPSPTLDRQQLALIRDIMSIATTLDLAVTAEGIETEAVAHDLRELGVDYGQGWHWARAMPIDDLEGWLTDRGLQSVTAD